MLSKLSYSLVGAYVTDALKHIHADNGVNKSTSKTVTFVFDQVMFHSTNQLMDHWGVK